VIEVPAEAVAVNCKAPAVPSSLQATVEAVASVMGSLIEQNTLLYSDREKLEKKHN